MPQREEPVELFMPPNVLKAKVGNFTGVDVAAIKRAETAMEGLKSNFVQWIEDDVRHLGEARERYANEVNAKSRAALGIAAHDIKGQAATFNFPLIARVAGSLANLIQDLAPEKELPLALVDAHVDAILVIHRQKITDAANPVAVTLAKELEARVAELLG